MSSSVLFLLIQRSWGFHAESTSHGCLQDWLRKHREMMVFYDGFLAGFWLCTTWEKGVLYKQSIKLVHNFILSSSQYLLSFADSSLNLNIWLPGCSFQFHWIFSGRSHLPGNYAEVMLRNIPQEFEPQVPHESRELAGKMGLFFLCRVCGVKCRWEHKLWRRQCMEIVACCIFVLFSKKATYWNAAPRE